MDISGAAMGHASSCITIMNLIRLGNKKILDKYNCRYLRDAAVEVTHITTGEKPHPKQHVYGARALDLIFGLEATKSRLDWSYQYENEATESCLFDILGNV